MRPKERVTTRDRVAEREQKGGKRRQGGREMKGMYEKREEGRETMTPNRNERGQRKGDGKGTGWKEGERTTGKDSTEVERE